MSTAPSFAAQAQGLALVLAAAVKNGLPSPHRVTLDGDRVDITLALPGVADWATWADATVSAGEPNEYMTGRWAVTYTAKGTIYDLPVTLSACEFGVMTEPDTFDCDHCGARFGSTGGFVADGTYDDWFEIELTRHMDGECVGSRVSA